MGFNTIWLYHVHNYCRGGRGNIYHSRVEITIFAEGDIVGCELRRTNQDFGALHTCKTIKNGAFTKLYLALYQIMFRRDCLFYNIDIGLRSIPSAVKTR